MRERVPLAPYAAACLRSAASASASKKAVEYSWYAGSPTPSRLKSYSERFTHLPTMLSAMSPPQQWWQK